MNAEQFELRPCGGKTCRLFNSNLKCTLPSLVDPAGIKWGPDTDCNQSCSTAPNVAAYFKGKKIDLIKNVGSPYPNSTSYEDVAYWAIDLKTKQKD